MENGLTVGAKGTWKPDGREVVVVEFLETDHEFNATGDQVRIGRREAWGFSSWLAPVAEFVAK